LRRRQLDVVTLGRGQGTDIKADLLADAPLDGAMKLAAADHLIHIAWYAEHGKFWTAPVNVDWVAATSRLVEAFCRTGGRRVVGVGTCAEYEWSQEARCVEMSTPLRPATPYGAAKNEAREAVARICATHDVPCAWARLFIPIGKGEASGRLIPSVIASLRGEREPFAIGGAASRDFLHVQDVAEALVELALSDATGPFNISSGQPTPVSDVVDHLAMRLRRDAGPLRRLYATRPGEPRLLCGDNSRLTALGWRQTLSLSDALDLIVR
jgi:nucleoside-diphosphate-sugar epimerase